MNSQEGAAQSVIGTIKQQMPRCLLCFAKDIMGLHNSLFMLVCKNGIRTRGEKARTSMVPEGKYEENSEIKAETGSRRNVRRVRITATSFSCSSACQLYIF